ncbi:EMBRYO SURROUNDING FACTOR 1-like protein 5 [Arabidopsis thaliana]
MSLLRFAILCIIFVSLFGMHECENVEAFVEKKINVPAHPCYHTYCGSMIRNCYCCLGKKFDYCSPNQQNCLFRCEEVNRIPDFPKTNGVSKGLGPPLYLFFLGQFIYFVLGL